MTKIAFIGAGSLGFTRELVRDILSFPRLEDAEIRLMDIDAERLDFSRRAVSRIVEMGKRPAKVLATMDREEALRGADVVLCTILAGGTEVWRYDIEIPARHGVDICVGDTRGPSGIFRFLRTAPALESIARDMERLCPGAVLLNYTNPMAMLCNDLQKTSSITVTGLCHSVQGTARMLAGWIGAPYEEIDYVCAGINHQAWYTEFKWKGKDAYPLIREAVRRLEVYGEEPVRNEMFLALDYYVTESSGHNSEYNPWFRKRKDLIEKYCSRGTGWNPGEHAYILKEYQNNEATWRDEARSWFDARKPIELERGEEYAAWIVNALAGGETFRFNGNVQNRGYVTNLPDGACVEVPVYVDRSGFHPVMVGDLPPQCAILTSLSSRIEETAVLAHRTGDARLVYQAVAHDPLTSAVLSLAEIRDLVREMFAANRAWLPQFESVEL
ncbi:MAG TPA: alpha-galactosidase [Spirochaetales bacterium]|nr:alpha-galactosidase [Spirochaetales bacterium]HRY53911.1 alpha-galactosidase [Spirochaetia bacterium]HRZ65305.1 alpha-galactosidase [Spirochaetia bacterium]